MVNASADALADRLQGILGPAPHDRSDVERLPSPVAVRLIAALDAEIAAAAALPFTDWIDAEAPAVRAAADAWVEAVHGAVRIPEAAWPEALRAATREAVRHLVRPVPALTAAAFDEHAGRQPVGVVLERMRGFAAYPYFADIAERYVERKDMRHLDREGVERLLRRIEQRLVEEFEIEDWIRLAQPLFDLFGPVVEPAGTVPASLLAAFLRERGKPGWAVALTEHEAYTPDSFREALERAARARSTSPEDDALSEVVPPGEKAEEPDALGSAEPVRKSPASHVSDSPPREDVEEETESAQDAPPRKQRESSSQHESSQHEEDDENEPLWKRLARHRGATVPDDEAAGSEAATGQTVNDEDPIWKRFSSSETLSTADAAAAVGTARPDAALIDDFADEALSLNAAERRALGESDPERRRWFVNALFSGSERDYGHVVRRLARVPSWTAASQIIARDVFRKHRVNIYSEPAVAFTDAVESQVRARNASS